MLLFSFIILTLLHANATEKCSLERINFLPTCTYFTEFSYDYRNAEIDAKNPDSAVQNINQYTNSFTASQGYRVNQRSYIGISVEYESSIESGAKYGISDFSRFKSRGFREPVFFTKYRLHEQTETRGLIDLFFSASYGKSEREVMSKRANRVNGRDVIQLYLSHGRLEEKWEFKSTLGTTYSSKGRERNIKTETEYQFSSTFDYNFDFSAQYEIQDQTYLYAIIGFVYRGRENIDSKEEMSREIQSGSGTKFTLGGKKNITKKILADFNYQISRRDYFIKSNPSFDGQETIQTFMSKIVFGF